MSERYSVRLINSMAIERLSGEEMARHRGDYAVLVGGEIESYHATGRAALEAAWAKYACGEFSIQRVEPQPIEFVFDERLANAILSRTTSSPLR